MAETQPAVASSRARRWLKRALWLVPSASVALIVTLLLALNLAPSREFVRTRVNGALSELFVGRVVLDRIGSLRLDRLAGIDAHVLDAQQRRVLSVYGLSLRSNWPQIVRALVLGRPLNIVLDPLAVDHVEVLLLADAEGVPTLAGAFNPRTPSAPSSTPATAEPATTIAIGNVHVRHIWAHGSLPSVSTIDAELFGVRGSFEYGVRGLLAKLTEARLTARALPARLDPRGSLRARLAQGEKANSALSGSADFRGDLLSAASTLHAEWDGAKLDALLQAPAVPAATLRKLLPSSKLEAPSTLEARVNGSLPKLDFDARVQNQGAEAQVRGHATLEDTTRVTAELSASEVDLQTLLGDAPKTRISLNALAKATISGKGAIDSEYQVTAPRGLVDTQATPPVSTKGKLVRSAEGNLRVDGALDVKEPGADTHADYHLQLRPDGTGSLHTDLVAKLGQPPRLRQLAGVSLAGSLTATADLDLATRRISARASAKVAPLVHPSARLGTLDLALRANGSASSPLLDLQADARDVTTPFRHFQRLQLTASGDLARLRIAATANGEQQQRFQAEARLSLGQVLVLDEPSVAFSDREGTVTARARRVRVASGTVRAEELELTGLGEVHANVSLGAGRVDTQFSIHELDLGRLSRLSALGFARSGKLSIDGNVAGPLSNLSGKLRGQARELDFEELRGGEFELDLELGQRKLNGSLAGKLGRSQIRAVLSEIDVPTAPFTTEKLRAVRGELSLNGVVDLAQAAPALRAANVPVERSSGQLTLEVNAKNPRAGEGSLRLDAHLRSQGLAFVTQRSEQENIESRSQANTAEPFALEGIDADVRLAIDPEKEHASAALALFDRLGPLLSVNAEGEIPGLARLSISHQLDTVPVRLSVRMPERALEKLPGMIRPSVMRGLARFELDAEGTLKEPRLRATLAIQRLQAREGRNSVELKASTEYANSGGKLEADARATRGGSASLRTTWTGNLLERAMDKDQNRPSPLDLGADLALDKFPLALVPELSDNQVRGPVSGELHLRGLGKNAELSANFDGSGMTVNRIAMPELKAALRADGRMLTATLDAVQSQGNARAELSAPTAWGERWAPEFSSRAKVSLKARAFELEALAPIVARYVSALEGQLDANLSAELDPKTPNIQGSATLKDGVFQLPQLGQRFSDVEAKLSVRDNEFQVDSLQARGITGKLTAVARAKLVGTDLQSASARVDIKEKEKLPITLEGVVLGDAFGHANLSYARAGANAPTEIKIDVPAFRLQMPDAAQNSVQDLDPAADIRIGARRSDGKFVAIPLQPFEVEAAGEGGAPPSLTRMRIHLGDSVWVERGRQATVQLTGDLEVRSGAEQAVTGRIELRGGKLDVSGKRFEIERGVISFEGDDPSNPTVTATARWDSPAEYSVYAEYSGTIKNGKLKLRSEPALTEDEILSLLLFGSPSGSMGASSQSGDSNNAGAAVSVAGDTATRGLNRAISDVTSLDVSTRIDTSTGSARPELVVQLTPRLTSRLTRAIGEPAPGESPDRTFITLELRLLRAWAISGVVGDHGGSALDLIWRNRY